MNLKKIENILDEIAGIYPLKRSAILPLLWRIQKEGKFITPEDIRFISERLNLSPAHLRSIATFYSMFFYNSSQSVMPARHLIQLCTNVSCMLMGAERLLDILIERYGLEERIVDGRKVFTSNDGRFSLITMECIGSCDVAPAMIVDEDLHTGLNGDNIFEILSSYK